RELRTFSAGVAPWVPRETGGGLVSRADEGLYEAKGGGGDARVVAESSLLVRLSPQHQLQGKNASQAPPLERSAQVLAPGSIECSGGRKAGRGTTAIAAAHAVVPTGSSRGIARESPRARSPRVRRPPTSGRQASCAAPRGVAPRASRSARRPA